MSARPFLVLSACLALAFSAACNRPPAPPAPTGPDYCFLGTAYTFKVVVTDPDADSVAARFDWGDSSVSDWSPWVASGHAISMTHAWQAAGTFEVRAEAKDRGHTSSWSAGLAVHVVIHRPPDMPSAPSGPDQGFQNSSCTFASTAIHPDNLPVAIRFAWGDGDTSDWSVVVSPGETARSSHAWSLPDTYAVTAQARDTGGAVSAWSLDRSFVVWPETLRWRYLTNRAVTSSPALGADGTVYFGSYDGFLYAVRPEGILRWRYETRALIRFSPAVAGDGTVYVGSDDGRIYALDPEGTLEWSDSIGPFIDHSPAIGADGTIYVGSADLNLHAFSPAGVEEWVYPIAWGIAGSPSIATNGTLYFGSRDSLQAVNADGTGRWRCYVGGYAGPAAIGADGTIYTGSRDSGLYAVDTGGVRKWRCPLSGDARTEPAIAADGTIYVGSTAGMLYAVHPDGTVWWEYATGGPVLSTPAVAADGTLYFGSDDGHVYALNPDGSLKWKYLTGDAVRSSPAIADDGVMYVGSSDSYLYALWSPSPPADSPWPRFRHDLKNTGRIGGGR